MTVLYLKAINRALFIAVLGREPYISKKKKKNADIASSVFILSIGLQHCDAFPALESDMIQTLKNKITKWYKKSCWYF